MKAVFAALALAAGLAAAAPSSALAPEPRKPVDVNRFLGRWLEVAHTPNARERNCVQGVMEWLRIAPARYSMLQTCRKRGSNAVETVKAGVRITDPRTNAKIEAGFFGGLIRSDYWILDHDDAYRWLIVSTSGGRYVWLLAREGFDGGQRSLALQTLRSLGYDPQKLVFPSVQLAGDAK